MARVVCWNIFVFWEVGWGGVALQNYDPHFLLVGFISFLEHIENKWTKKNSKFKACELDNDWDKFAVLINLEVLVL